MRTNSNNLDPMVILSLYILGVVSFFYIVGMQYYMLVSIIW